MVVGSVQPSVTIATVPAWSDDDGWSQPQHYATIQLGDVNGDGKDELLARTSDGIQTWAFDVATGQWQQLSAASPPWTDADNWSQPACYSTIQTADIIGDGRAALLGRSAGGMQTWLYDVPSGQWQSACTNNPALTDASTWNLPQYYETIMTADVNGDEKAELLARGAAGLYAWTWSATDSQWSFLGPGLGIPAWSDANGWSIADRADAERYPGLDVPHGYPAPATFDVRRAIVLG